MILFFKFFFIMLCFSASTALAFQIDTLTKVITNDNEYLEITGGYDREYIHTQLTRVFTDKKDGFREESLNPERVSDWPVIVEPGEIVLDKGDKVRIRINRNGPPRDEDIVLGLAFIPENVSGKSEKKSGLQISVGYKAWLFIPGQSSLRGQVTALRENGKLVISNMTNKILRITPVGCDEINSEACSGSVISLPETRKQLDINEGVRGLAVYLIGDSQEKIKDITL